MMFQKAEKKRQKLRLAITGASGSGKTYSALSIAKGMKSESGRIALIDTEHGSASKYADLFDFDTAILAEDQRIPAYIDAINAAGQAGYEVIVIDSMTHAWESLLEEVDRLAKTKYRGNSFQAWSEGTPIQRSFIESILKSPAHVIATMRVKTDYVMEEYEVGGRKKSRPVKVGLKPEQRQGIDYEFDMVIEVNTEHIATVSKSRIGKYQDAIISKPGADFGRDLAEWLNDGAEPLTVEQIKTLFGQCQTLEALHAAFVKNQNQIQLFTDADRLTLRNEYRAIGNLIRAEMQQQQQPPDQPNQSQGNNQQQPGNNSGII